jgi:Zn-dependent peptidase ImmA (M78 family)
MIDVAYPSYPSGEPRPMKAVVVQDIATELRHQLFKGAARKIEVPELVRRAVHMNINGRAVRFIWDIGHAVHGKDGQSVLGVCEYDPQEPRSVMISIHADLAKEPELFRSTTVHELAHAIFDMPAGMGGEARRVFRTRHDLTRSAAPIDWREWRADVTGTDLRLRWRGNGKVPTPALLARETAAEELDGITDLLAEEFGVSPAFMAVRLSKYGHVIVA